uniref:Uncharacterized protein n=1 Tax=Chromera velia CCMP2878 TaxID=1169474 RepID=A0A0G4HWS4_9ALVE|mmetsp:Transcript_20911/g.41699  ORF Transcript_20911/g.41699 Transcript_20911/m.41699 type:complete len:356 (-) Transcript_20911:269-1336(-)|eukprot:Cvel_1457.t1-p1 / transcript=Cvel_1457.t1 / gene=Cvel_1457 / organism=Chromera_velia_CCMP2878 / gene_product=hypothetical protein / transcript_product=hypothetical protein / location=Cvel_scaffold51:49552-50616(+) / protein_length=355 / sequence_SO=supercontig / SO=protein_coding / is_pseudo=false
MFGRRTAQFMALVAAFLVLGTCLNLLLLCLSTDLEPSSFVTLSALRGVQRPSPGRASRDKNARKVGEVNRELIREILLGQDPLDARPVMRPDHTYQFTHFDSKLFSFLLEKVSSSVSVSFLLEVGSFKGGSAIQAAQELKRTGLGGVSLVCVDPGTGGVNDWLRNVEGDRPSHLLTGGLGRPRVFETFLANILDKKQGDQILPLQMTGLVGMKLLKKLFEARRLSSLPQMVYLDAAHEKGETRLELEAAWEVLSPCGFLWGDDFDWEAVRSDVSDFVREVKPVPAGDGDAARLRSLLGGGEASAEEILPGLVVVGSRVPPTGWSAGSAWYLQKPCGAVPHDERAPALAEQIAQPS